MGTRADFYVGSNESAEWIGSIAWNGYRNGIPDAVLLAKTEPEYREAVKAFFKDDREDVTLPEMGWPWPWDDSGTSDCSYWFFDGKVWDVGRVFDVDCYFPCDAEVPEDIPPAMACNYSRVKYPNMSAKKKVTLGKRSGVIVVGSWTRSTLFQAMNCRQKGGMANGE